MTGGGGGIVGIVPGPALHGVAETNAAAWQAALTASVTALAHTMPPETAALPAATPTETPGEPVANPVVADLASAAPIRADPAAVTVLTGRRDASEGHLLPAGRESAGMLPADIAAGGAGRQFAGETVTTTGPATPTPPTPSFQTAALARFLAQPGAQLGAQPLAQPGAQLGAQGAGMLLAQVNPSGPDATLSSIAHIETALSAVVRPDAHALPTESTVLPSATLVSAVPIETAGPPASDQALPAGETVAMRAADAVSLPAVPIPAQSESTVLASAGAPSLAAVAQGSFGADPLMLAVDYPGVPPGAGPLRPNLVRQRRTAPLVHHAPPREPSLLVQDFRTARAAIQCVHYGERRPLPIDIAPHVAGAPVWRIDDTEVLVVADDGGGAAARSRAAGLHRALLDEGAGLAALQPGEGFATWDGSPLWLRLSGIDKPMESGVLLTESSPARLSVMRTGETTWRIDRDDHARASRREPLHLTGTETSDALRDAMLFAGPVDGVGAVFAALRAAAGLPSLERFRVQEAWAAVARWGTWHAHDAGQEMRRCLDAITGGMPAGPREAASATQVLDAARHGDAATLLARLRGLGAAVLDRVAAGHVQDIGAIEGLALAAALGRLPVWSASS